MPEGAAPAATFALVAGGGTAGHVLPGLAVATELVRRGHPRASIHFVGSEHGSEADLVGGAGFGFTGLPGRGIQRRLTADNLGAAWGLARGVALGVALVRRRRPRVVLVLGGFASVPCTVGAWLARVPMVVTEQNVRAGAASRLASRLGATAAVPFERTDLPRAVVTGNPVRPEILAVDRAHDRGAARAALDLPADRAVVAAFAGSLGARHLNEVVRDLAVRWGERTDVAVHHVVGRRDWDARSAPLSLVEGGLAYRAVAYEERMDLLLAAADVAVCRAGGTTVAELAQVGLPAVLVPLPGAPRDHQSANAAALVEAGAARLVPDGELDAERLGRELEGLLGDRAALAAMGEAARGLARPDAAQRVADLVERAAGGRRG